MLVLKKLASARHFIPFEKKPMQNRGPKQGYLYQLSVSIISESSNIHEMILNASEMVMEGFVLLM